MGVEAVGFKLAERQLKGLETAIADSLPSSVELAAKLLRPELTRRAPVDTGALKKSITDTPGEAVYNRFARHLVIVGVYYAPFVEYGHGGPAPAPPHPYLRPSADFKRRDMANAIKANTLRFTRRVTGL